MAEILFVLLTVYVVFVIQSVFYKTDKKKPALQPEVEVKPAVVTEAVAKVEQQVVDSVKPAVKKAPVKKEAAKKVSVKKTTTVKTKAKASSKPATGDLRNPETGDVDKIASSYRMTKRWIKEALVTEGLLPKVYKTAELDDATKLKINKALVKLAKMDKYK